MQKNAKLKEALPYCNAKTVVPFHENFPVTQYSEETGTAVLTDAVNYFMNNDAFGIWCTKPYAYITSKDVKALKKLLAG